MSVADGLLVAWVLVFAASGFFRGFAAQLLSLLGLGLGAIGGASLAPHFLAGGDQSPWVPVASLLGGLVGALVVGGAASLVSGSTARFLAARPSLNTADRVGGVAVGAALGLALAWLAVVLFLHQPGLGLRHTVQGSRLLPALVRFVPPEPVLRALNRFDPFPVLPEFAAEALPAPDPSVLRSAGARTAAASVVKVEGTSCGLGVQGSGWVVRRGLVATNAHVVAGQTDTSVLAPNEDARDATVVYVDGVNDVALLRVQGLGAPPLAAAADGAYPREVVLLGYPRDGPLTAAAGTAGKPRGVVAPDAYERTLRPRTVVPLRGSVQPGDSGGPVVDRRGSVLAMMFGGTRRGRDGFGVPVPLVTRGLERARGPIDPGPCVG